jgi:hypothetical protein
MKDVYRYTDYPTPNGGCDLTVEVLLVFDWKDGERAIIEGDPILHIEEIEPESDRVWVEANEDTIIGEVMENGVKSEG